LFDLWENKKEDPLARKLPISISAPKMQLPGHAESYNPPEEYLFTKKELKQWKMTEPEDRT
jgi:ribosome biogenesis protein ERB1